MDHRDLAAELVRLARARGADAADVLVAEGTEFTARVRKGDVETLTEAGSKALWVRVFVGRRTATAHTSDFSWPTLRRLVEEAVALARATGEVPAAGLPPRGQRRAVPRRERARRRRAVHVARRVVDHGVGAELAPEALAEVAHSGTRS